MKQRWSSVLKSWSSEEISKYVHKKDEYFLPNSDMNSVNYFKSYLKHWGYVNIQDTTTLYNDRYWCCDIECENKQGKKIVFELKSKNVSSERFTEWCSGGKLMCDYEKIKHMRYIYPNAKKILVNMFTDVFAFAEIENENDDSLYEIIQKEMPTSTYFKKKYKDNQKEIQTLFIVKNNVKYVDYATGKVVKTID